MLVDFLMKNFQLNCEWIDGSGPEEKSVYIDTNTRIQIVDTMLLLPQAEKEQCAAFIVSPPLSPRLNSFVNL